MNTTNYSSNASNAFCFRSVIPDDQYMVADHVFSVLAVIINLLTCPLVIFLNAVVIILVKIKRRLQTNYNILLASLAGTDLLVGLVAQPAFVAQEIYLLVGGSPSVFCTLDSITQVLTICLCLASLFNLVLISVERFVAMKYSLRYESIVTKFRLTAAVACSWLTVAVYCVFRIFPGIIRVRAHVLLILSLLVITFCHISVYFVSRRHMIQIKSEQVSQETSAKFLAERKAWKTTSIIISVVFLCYLPGSLQAIAFNLFTGSLIQRVAIILRPLTFSSYMLNSLCNPIIYCWRSKQIREAMMQLLKRQSN